MFQSPSFDRDLASSALPSTPTVVAAAVPIASSVSPLALVARDRLRWLASRLAIATWFLMAIGSATRVTNAGLACPDWPLCYGQAIPWAQMNLQVFLEWFHRLDAGLLAVGSLVLAIAALRDRAMLPVWAVVGSVVAPVAIALQATLGALTVTQLLRFDIVTAHLGLALVSFGLFLGLAVGLLPFRGTGAAGTALPWAGAIATVTIYGQSLLGGLVGSRWALHQCLDTAHLCGWLHSHLLGIVPAVLAVGVVLWLAWRTPALHQHLRWLRGAIAALLAVQLLVGYGTFHLHLQIEPLTVAHQAIGAALLGALVSLTILGFRDQPTALA